MSLKGVCRACLSARPTMCSLLESIVPKFDSPPNSVVDLWNIFAKILISSEDKFPNKICSECLDEIQRSYSFVLKCKRSEDVLTETKDDKICLKKSKTVSALYEDDSLTNVKTENYLYPDISQIKIENIESNESENGYVEDGIDTRYFEANIHPNIDSHVDPGSQQPLIVQQEDVSFRIEVLDHLNYENDGTNHKVSATHDIKQEPEMDNDEPDEIESEDKSNIKIFKCLVCNYESSMVESLDQHTIEQHMDGQMCKLCNKEFKCTAIEHCSTHLHVNSTKGVLKPTNRKQYKCEYCAKIFRRKFSLTVHIRCHTGERPYKCETCSQSFVHKTHLTDHLRCHTGERPYKCEMCPQTFGQKWHLTAHIRCHTGERPFKCEICFKNFQHKHDLTRHSRSHTGERPFTCEICSKTFQQKTNLTTHLRCHTGERPYKCEICSKGFQQKPDLTRHLLCHTGERPFKCEICQKTFQLKHNLTRHLRSHTGECPFKCEICLKTFGQKCDMMRHLRNHTAKDVRNKRFDPEQTEREQFKMLIHDNFDSQVNQKSQATVQHHCDNLGKEQFSHMNCENDAAKDKIPAIQDIKQEPEEFMEILFEGKSSTEMFKCSGCCFEFSTVKSLEKHICN